MGYVPPVKDEQSTVYASRQAARMPMISRLTSTDRAEFAAVLQYKVNDRDFSLRYSRKHMNKQKAVKKERELSGKGNIIDESV